MGSFSERVSRVPDPRRTLDLRADVRKGDDGAC
jgi:hypothetical protein